MPFSTRGSGGTSGIDSFEELKRLYGMPDSNKQTQFIGHGDLLLKQIQQAVLDAQNSNTLSDSAALENLLNANRKPVPMSDKLPFEDLPRAMRKPKGEVQPDPMSPLDQFVNQLLQQVGSSQPVVDYEDSLRQSNQDIRDAFARDIAGVKTGMGRARNQANVGRRDIMAMYRALSRDYAKGAKNEVSQGQRVANAIQNVANQAQNQITKSANQQLQEQAALAEGLGVEAALPSVAAAQRNNLLKTVNRIQGRGQRAANDTLTYSGTQQRFLDRGGKNALLEGTNRSADLLADLQDYLQGANDKIAGLQSDRDRSLAANRTAVLKSVQDAQQSANNDIFDQLLKIGQFKFGAEDDLADNKLALMKMMQQQQPSDETNFPEFSQNYANILSTLDPNVAERVKGILDPIVNGQQFAQGRFAAPNTDEMLDLTPIEAGNMAVQALKQRGISDPQILETARQAAMAYAQGSR